VSEAFAVKSVEGDLYDYPSYYDLVYGSDWKAELGFLLEVFQKHARRKVRRLFEPACGTGRLLYRLANAGFEVSGLDLNEKSIVYCNKRLRRHGLSETTFVGDMSDFRLPRKVDGAFNMINSFRHLSTQRQAKGHLESVAKCLTKGGIYVLGLHLTPLVGDRCEEESWSARRGNLAVIAHLATIDLDLKHREERVAMSYDVYTPTRQFRLNGKAVFRTYTAKQMLALLKQVPELELVETYDFAYDIDAPIPIDPESEDTVFILRRR